MHRNLNFSIIYISVVALIFSQSIPTYAGLIVTEQILAQQHCDHVQLSLQNGIEREEAKHILEFYGVSPEQAQLRINAMTNDEARFFAQKFENLPAGGVGAIAAILILFLLFIALDLSGKTDILNDV